MKAARRAIETLLAEDLELKVLILPDGKDPDDFIRANGAESYNALRGKAFPYLQFVLDSAVQERNLNVPKQKAEAIEDVLPVLGAVRNHIQMRESFDQAMDYLRVEDAVLKRDLWNVVKQGSRVESGAIKQQVARASRAKMTVAEQRLLELVIFDDELRELILSQLEETDYDQLATAPVFRALYELRERKEKVSLESLLELVGDDETISDYVPVLLMSEPFREPDEVIDNVLHDAENCVFTLRSMAISNRILDISQELIYAEQNGNDEMLNNLVAEQMELAQMKRELQRKIVEI